MAQRSHLLLDSRTGWRVAELEPSLELDDRGRLALQPLPGSGRPLADAAGSFGGLARPTGLAVDGDGRVWITDAEQDLLRRYDPCTCRFEVMTSIAGPGREPRELREPRGLLICGGDLWLADSGNRRIQVFSLKGLALRRIWGPYRVRREGGLRLEPAAPVRSPIPELAGPCTRGEPRFPAATWRPWDLAAGFDGTVWVSDPENGLVHRFDRCGVWHGALEAAAGSPLARPSHLATDAEGRLYVVDEGRGEVLVFGPDGSFLERLERAGEARGRFRPTAVAVDPEGNLYLSCAGSRGGGDDVCVHRRLGTGGACCGGPARAPRRPRCAVAGGGRVLAFDGAGNPLAVAGSRIMVLDPGAAFETAGRYLSEPLDSRIYRCPWHRVILDAEVPFGTRVRVETFTSESPKDGAEIAALPDSRWSLGAEHTLISGGEWDCLVRSAPGRYLWLRLALAGDGTASPGITAVRLELPRASSLRHLPAPYREDPESRDFLDRFLSIFDTLRGEIGDRIGDVAGLFDPQAAPVDFLPWLASWLGLALEQSWPEAKRRRLLAAAHRLYALRGTPAGLRLHVRLYTGLDPRILEHFAVRRWLHLGSARLGDCAELWGADLVDRLQLDESSRIGSFQLIDSGDPVSDPFHHLAHRFTVYVPLGGAASDELRRRLERIVELAKPAHAEGEVAIVEPLLRIGVQARVGVDTVVGRYPEGVVAGDVELGRGSVLGPSAGEAAPPTLTVGVRSRIGTSTLID